jgi:hypothetical protein
MKYALSTTQKIKMKSVMHWLPSWSQMHRVGNNVRNSCQGTARASTHLKFMLNGCAGQTNATKPASI